MAEARTTVGTVYLVGAGPGAPDLLTLRAARLLDAAEVVFHDALVHPDTLALAAGAEKIAVGKRHGRHSTAQHFINKRLVDAARKHRVVVRLKGGDPMLFGRAQEEIAALQAAGVPFEIVPGITAALAACADLGVSLTRRGVARNAVFATPRVGEGETGGDWAAPLAQADSCAIYMGVHEAASVAAQLIARGRDPATPLAVVENASLGTRRTWAGTLAELPLLHHAGIEGPAVILLGEVFAGAAAAGLAAPQRAATGR
jgi:uroporphyrin-III C-methyltransferase